MIGLAYSTRIGDDFEVRLFQILEQNVAVKGKIELRLIQKMEDDDVVAFEAKQAKPFENRLRVIEEIGYQNHQAPPFDLAGDLFENSADVGFPARPAILQGVKNLRQIVSLGLRRDEGFDAVREGYQAGGILLFKNQIGKRRGERAAVVEFGHAIGGIVHGAARIEQQIGAEIGFVLVFFDEIAVEFSQGFPVDAADFVARRIFPVFFEFDAETLGPAAVHAGHDAFYHPARPKIEIGNAGENLRIEITLIAVDHEADSLLPPPFEII